VPHYKEGMTVKEAAADSASMYGCTKESPKSFGVDVIGIEIQGMYDGVLYWQCKKCEGYLHRFDGTWYNEFPTEHRSPYK